MSAKAVLERAQAVLNERGWTRKQDVDLLKSRKSWIQQTDKPICLWGAISQAREETKCTVAAYWEALDYVAQAIGKPPQYLHPSFAIWEWNDAKGRNKQDVDLVLTHAIAKCND